MISRILFATDLGLYSPYLMRQLVRLTSKMEARVDIVHVIEPMGVFAESIINAYVPEKDRRYLRQHGLNDVKNKIESALRNDYQEILSQIELGEVIIEIGFPSEMIIQKACALESDMILLGSHGRSAFQGGAMGAVVSKVLGNSPIPVLIVPMINLGDVDRLNN
jgi:nucleotide-binding universal stress UspA family protein